MTPAQIKALVRTIPDFPAKGIAFRDITTLLSHGQGFAACVALLAERAWRNKVEAIAGMEARGFIFGAAVAVELQVGFVPIRKPGKLPMETIGVDYALEYGSDRLEMDSGCVAEGARVAIVDDLIATGGTAIAAVELLRKAGAVVEEALFAIDLPALGGAARLKEAGVTVDSIMQFEDD